MAEGEKLRYSGILKGVLASFLATLVCMLILTAVCYFGNISDALLGVLVFLASVACVLLGGVLVSKSAGKSGLLHGLLLGAGYFLVILLLSWLFRKGIQMDMHLLTLLFGSLCGGMLGGVLGVNAKN